MNKIYSGKYKWFDGDCLVYVNGTNKINWRKCNGCIVEFECKGYHGHYTILNVVKNLDESTNHLKAKDYFYEICFNHNPSETFIVDHRVLRNVNFEYRLGIYSMDYIYNIGDIIKEKYIVLDRCRKIFYPKDKNPVRVYKLECLKDNYIFELPEYMIQKQQTLCPLCSSTVVVEGKNDIGTLKPEIIKFLKNPSDAYQYAATSNKKLLFKCDICGYEFEAAPGSFPLSLPCKCYARYSYPNRLIYKIFEQLNIPFTRELSKSTFEWCEVYRFDLYFEMNNKKYIVEMDGGFHKYEITAKRDIEKNRIAKENNIILIRIDCDYKKSSERFSYIKNSILNSELNKIVCFDNVDWEKANFDACYDNILKQVCDLRLSGYTNKEISNQLNIPKSTILNCVRLGIELHVLKSAEDRSYLYCKVMEIYDINSNTYSYCINLKNFFNNVENYLDSHLSRNYFNKNNINNELHYEHYILRSLSYSEYCKKMAAQGQSFLI